ncbi:YdeI/OmpD-associated family protein [Gordonia sinesedis]
MKAAEQAVRFDAPLSVVATQTIARLPATASTALPSRGQVSVSGTIDGHEFSTVVEPDGDRGHWVRIPVELQRAAGVAAGDTATFALTPTQQWPEPNVPDDLAAALSTAPPNVQEKWQDITPMARWEWVRWVNATGSPKTRAVRIEKTISKLDGEHRRPCCFNLAACTDPEVSKSGRLIAPQ